MKNRKMIVIGIALVIILLMTTCRCSQSNAGNHRMVIIDANSEIDGYICYDRKTKVEYFVSAGMDSRGVLTVLVDADGKPLLYDGE